MTIGQLKPLWVEKKTWNAAVIQTSFRQPLAIGPSSKIDVAEGILSISDDDDDHPFKVDKEGKPLPVSAIMHIEIVHIHSVDYFTEKKIVSVKKPLIVVP